MASAKNFFGTPSSIDPNQKFDTGIPGFDVLAQSASQNVGDLLTGAPSLDRNRNAGATYAASMGLAPAGGTGDFMDRWNYDLYGAQSDQRKGQGLQGLLGLLGGFSGNVTARPGEILGTQTAMRGQDISAAQADADRAQRAREAEMDAMLQSLGLGIQGANTANNMLSSYLNFFQ